MLVVFYIVIFAGFGWFLYSQRKQAQQHAQLIATVEVGDDIVTTAGIYGTIVGFDPDDPNIMALEVAEGVVIDVERVTVQKVAVDDETEDDENTDDDDDSTDENTDDDDSTDDSTDDNTDDNTDDDPKMTKADD